MPFKLYSFCIILLRERERERERERADCFTLILLLLRNSCLCAVSIPRGVMGWSMVCDCGISWSHSLKLCCCLFVNLTSFEYE